MKLIAASIKNFRIHCGDEPVEVRFDPRLHVIHGPNESGKSTIMHAVASCLFEKASLTGKAFEAMQPDDGSKPELSVTFEVGHEQYTVRKHFKGQSGTCELSIAQDGRVHATHRGSEAESKLNDILRLPDATRGDRKAEQMALWRLLWISQGQSIELPTDDINPETRDDLQNLLMAETGEAMTTAAEAAWIESLEKQVAERFTSTGKPKAGSAVVTLTSEIEQLEQQLEQATSLSRQVEQNSDRHVENQRRIVEIMRHLPRQKEQLESHRQQKLECEQLRQKMQQAENRLQIAQRDLDAALDCRQNMSRLHEAIAKQTAEAKTSDTTIKRIDEQLTTLQAKRLSQETICSKVDTAFADARRQTLRSQAHAGAIRARAQHAARTEQFDKAAALDEQRKAMAIKLAAMPVHEQAVDELQACVTQHDKVQAALEAASAKLKITSTQRVHLTHGHDAEELPSDTEHARQIEQPARITIGDDMAVIHITPGGEDLDQRRTRVADARQALQDQLDALGVDSIGQARQRLRDRQQLEQSQQNQLALFKEIAPKGLEALRQDVEAAELGRQRAEAELGRHTRPDDESLPGDPHDADADTRQRQDVEATAERHRDAQRQQLQLLDEQIGGLKADRRLAVQSRDEHRARATEGRGALDDLTTAHGQAAVVETRIGTLKEQVATLEVNHKEYAKALDAMQPRAIEGEIERLERAVKSTEQEQRDVEHEQIHLHATLTASDAIGLNERIGDLTAHIAAKSDELARQQLQADAMQLLLKTVTACRESMTRQIMEPLRQKVAPLLRLVFRDAQLDFTIDEQTRQLSLKPLTRSSVQDSFSRLSVGTREQVGIAIRLALAQVLAESYGGTLPVILDEPFVNTDQQRLQRVLGMLSMVKNDLQLIVLTCDYSDYRDLGLSPTQVTELLPPRRH